MNQPFVEGIIVDHVGIVCADVHAAVARFRAHGYIVSDPVPLMAAGPDGTATPLGQDSAHIVFQDGYVEISAPWPDFGNHLDPYLAQGPGVRILCLRSHDIAADHARLHRLGLAASPVQASSRAVRIDGADQTAHFRWVAIRPDFWPGVLVALVAHMTPDVVFAPSLLAHANGARRLSHIIASAGAPDTDTLLAAFGCSGEGPRLVIGAEAGPRPLPAIVLTGEKPAMMVEDGYFVRIVADSEVQGVTSA